MVFECKTPFSHTADWQIATEQTLLCYELLPNQRRSVRSESTLRVFVAKH